MTATAIIRRPDSSRWTRFVRLAIRSGFPEQIAEGLRPWQPRKVYIGGVARRRAVERARRPGQYSPWLGMSYGDFARVGLSYQRSQNSGRLSLAPGPQYGYYQRVDAAVGDRSRDDIGPSAFVGARENGFFDGIEHVDDRPVQRHSAPDTGRRRGAPAGRSRTRSMKRCSVSPCSDPSASVPALARGLAATRCRNRGLAAEPDAVFVLQRKEAQFLDAINTAMGVVLTALAEPAGSAEPTGPVASPDVMGPVVPETALRRAHHVCQPRSRRS